MSDNNRKIVLYPAEGGGNDIPEFGMLSDDGFVDIYSHNEIQHDGNRYKCVPDWMTKKFSNLMPAPWYTRRGTEIKGSKLVRIHGRKYFYEEKLEASSDYDSSKKYIYTKYAADVY